MQISNVSNVEVIRTMEGNTLIRYTVEQPASIINGTPVSHTATILLRGTMNVEFHDLRPWVNQRKLERVK